MKVLITTVVDAKYMAFAPMFVYCCRQAYPEYDVKIILRDKCLYLLDCETVLEFQGFPRYLYNTIALRFVVPLENYDGYDYVWITDIDIMMMREDPQLANVHEKQMVETKMCYSNSLRNKDHYLGSKSLSGLHFATQEWFDRVEPERRRYYDLLQRGLVGLYREYDGVMLYRMCERSGVRLPGKYKLIKRHGGIHLGSFRLFDDKEKWADRIPMDFRIGWLRLMEKQAFRDIVERSCRDSYVVAAQVGMLNEFIRS